MPSSVKMHVKLLADRNINNPINQPKLMKTTCTKLGNN